MLASRLSPAVSEALDRFARGLRDRFGSRVSEIVLFGSHARGEAGEESDVDVMVAIENLSDEERLEVLDLASVIDRTAPEWLGVSALPYSTAQAAKMRSGGRRLLLDIDREGVRL